MKTDRHSVVLLPSTAQAVGNSRGHRSLSLGDENLTLAKGKGQTSIPDRTNINSRGWNNSTRASPIWKRRLQENKENGKPLVSKKFQHVQSKLSAPVFSQRRAKLADVSDKGPGADAGPSPDALNVLSLLPDGNCRSSSTEDPQGPATLVAFDQYVTKRDRNQSLVGSPSWSHDRPASSSDWNASTTPDEAAEELPAEVGAACRPPASPQQRRSPHPSVSALYLYAEEVRTPLSRAATPTKSVAPLEVAGDKSAAPCTQPEGEELTDSFTSWLRSMGMQPHILPTVVLDKMGALWQKAKEAAELLALVGRLKDAQENARTVDVLLAEENHVEDAKTRLQQQLLEAEERLAQLALSHTPVGDAEAARESEAASTTDAQPVAQYAETGADQGTTSTMSTGLSAVAEIDSPTGSTASVALWAQTPGKGSEDSSQSMAETRFTAPNEEFQQNDGLPQGAPGWTRGADSPFSISLGSQVQPSLSSTSVAVAQGLADDELPSPSSCAGFTGAPSCGATTPAFSIVSRAPEPVPFAAWMNRVDGVSAAASPAAPQTLVKAESVTSTAAIGTPEGAMPSPDAAQSAAAEASDFPDALSHHQSAGLSFASQTVQPDIYAEWEALASKTEPTPTSLRSTYDCSANSSSPQLSAGLSVISSMPQAVAFDVWASVQHAREARSAAAYAHGTPASCGPESPLSSVGFETVSKPNRAGANTGAGAGAAHASPAAAHVRCNPLFEIDSPASCMSALPERADALGGLAASPSPARMLTPPSLASTPMSDFSQGLRTNLNSPMCDAFIGSPASHLYGGLTPAMRASSVYGDTTSPAAPLPCKDSVAIAGTASNPLESISPALPGADEVADKVFATEADPAHESPMQGEASFVDAIANAVDEKGSSSPPSPSKSSPSCATPLGVAAATGADVNTADVGNTPGACSPKDLSSPAATNVIASDFAASPVVDAPPAPQLAEFTDTRAVEQDDVAADARAVCTEARAPSCQLDQSSPAADGTNQKSSPAGTSVDGAAVGAAACGDGQSPSYPNTPSAAWPASPTTVYATPLEAFATPTSLASFCSAVRLTAMRLQADLGTPGGSGASPSDFTFGFHAGLAGGRLDAATPMLGPPVENGSSASPVATLGLNCLLNANTPAAGFGSPLPLKQLTPVQLRALDHLAGHVMAALAPTCKPESPHPAAAQNGFSTSSDPKPGAAAAAVAFDLAQLLTHLRSPLPAPIGHQKSRFAPVATKHADAVQAAPAEDQNVEPEDESAPSGCTQAVQAGAKVDVGSGQTVGASIDEAAVPLPVASPLPNFARLMAFLNAGGRTVAGSHGCVGAVDSEHMSGTNAAECSTATGAGFDIAQLLANLHSPLPNQVRMVDSPVVGDQNSPATSEAASSAFGFSTAAKMQTRPTPTFTPGGGGVSFMRWAHDAGPPSFRLDSDARHQPHSRAARTPPTPMSFSFGVFHGMPTVNEDGTPMFGHGHSQRSYAAHELSPAGQILHLMANASPALSGTAALCPENPVTGAVGSPAFSFGLQLSGPAEHVATPTAPFGHLRTQGGVAEPEPVLSAVKSWYQASPGLSLGVWGFHSYGEGASVLPRATPSERGFTFNNGAGSLMPTPMWPGLGGPASPGQPGQEQDEVVGGLSAALDQRATAASPVLFSIATQGSAHGTPEATCPAACKTAASPSGGFTTKTITDVYAPAAAVLWAALLGNLQSPMPAAVRIHPKEFASVPAVTSLGAGPEAGSPLSGSMPDPADATAQESSAARSTTEVGTNDLPPSYEDLPDLIARGLCLPASASSSSAKGLADACASAVSTKEPPFADCMQASAADAIADEVEAGGAAPVNAAAVPERLFQPVLHPFVVRGLDGSPIIPRKSLSGQLKVESVSGSNGDSVSTFYAVGEAAGRTSEPAQTPRVEDPTTRVEASPTSGGHDSVHGSPVFSFHVASEGSVQSADSPVPVSSTAACANDIPPEDQAACIITDCNKSPVGAASSKSTISSRHDNTANGPRISSPALTEPESVAFSLDAVPRLLFSASAETSVTEGQSNAAATSFPEPLPSSVPTLATSDEASNSLAGAEVLRTLAMASPAPSKRRDVPDVAASPLTFSYLSSSPPPSTPPTSELASTAKGWSVCHPRISPRGSAGGAQFWAPSPAGPSAIMAERVMLETSSRRIRANPDLLLDFQGSPGHIPPAMPLGVALGSGTPRIGLSAHRSGAAQSALHTSPIRKNWEPALGVRDQQPSLPPTATVQTSAGAFDSAALELKDNPAAPVAAVKPLPALQPVGGPSLQQQMAMGIEHTLATLDSLPGMRLSQFLGLRGTSARAQVAGGQHIEVQGADVMQMSHAAVAVGKPNLTSRDVQTTPSLAMKTVPDAPASQMIRDEAGAHVVPERSAVVTRRPPYKSRIPAPGGVLAPVPAPAAVCSSVQQSGASSVANSDEDVNKTGDTASAPAERVFRRRRLHISAASVGGPQRMVVKRGTSQPRNYAQDADELATLGDAEMRRRAQVMGMRISPYLRTKPGKARVVSEAVKKG